MKRKQQPGLFITPPSAYHLRQKKIDADTMHLNEEDDVDNTESTSLSDAIDALSEEAGVDNLDLVTILCCKFKIAEYVVSNFQQVIKETKAGVPWADCIHDVSISGDDSEYSDDDFLIAVHEAFEKNMLKETAVRFCLYKLASTETLDNLTSTSTQFINGELPTLIAKHITPEDAANIFSTSQEAALTGIICHKCPIFF